MPPGDLRMALAALCGDDESGRTWADVLQYRFDSDGALGDHAIGNLLIAGLWERLGDPVAGLDMVGAAARGRGPGAADGLGAVGDRGRRDRRSTPTRPDEISEVRGQAKVAKTTGRGERGPAQPDRSAGLPGVGARWCSTRTGSCSDPARGSPRSSRTCWCPELAAAIHDTAARRHPDPQPRARPRRPPGSPRPGTSSCWPSTPRTCGSTSCWPTAGSPRPTGPGDCSAWADSRRAPAGGSPIWPPGTGRPRHDVDRSRLAVARASEIDGRIVKQVCDSGRATHVDGTVPGR